MQVGNCLSMRLFRWLCQIAAHDHKANASASLIAELVIASGIVVRILAQHNARVIRVLGMRHVLRAKINAAGLLLRCRLIPIPLPIAVGDAIPGSASGQLMNSSVGPVLGLLPGQLIVGRQIVYSDSCIRIVGVLLAIELHVNLCALRHTQKAA